MEAISPICHRFRPYRLSRTCLYQEKEKENLSVSHSFPRAAHHPSQKTILQPAFLTDTGILYDYRPSVAQLCAQQQGHVPKGEIIQHQLYPYIPTGTGASSTTQYQERERNIRKSSGDGSLDHALTYAAVEISTVWCKHQMFAQNRTATASVHTEVNP